MERFENSLEVFISSSSFWTIVGVILGSILTYFLSSFQVKRNEKKEIIEFANIIYFDFKKSTDALKIQSSKENEVLENRITNLDEQYQNIIIKLRKKLTSHELNDLWIYYSNLSLLEDKRKEYWKADEEKVLEFQKKKYLNIFEMVNNFSKEKINTEHLLIKVKKIAKVKI